ncbi:MAG: hypothetical protein QW778_05180 [Candidatus Micrarchaeaceae archaeon]
MQIPNIYTYKNLKLLILIPVVLLFIGLYLSTHLMLDTSLSGGITITLSSNSTMSAATLASTLSKELNTPVTVTKSALGGYSITIAANRNFTIAESQLMALYLFSGNYTAYAFNKTSAELSLQRSPGNATLLAIIAKSQAGINESLRGMSNSLSSEASELAYLVGSVHYNASNATEMVAVAQGLYNNATAAYKAKVISLIEGALGRVSISEYENVTPTLGRYFLSQVETVIIIAFVLISIAVFFIFRSIVPSLAIIFGAGNDIIVAIGMMGLFGIPMGISSLGGLLMLIGYSIDTEILTSIRILKRKEGIPEERAYSAMKTGLTMTTTAIVAFATLFIVSIIAYVPTYFEISGVVLFGLIADIFTTWFGNAPMVLLYKKRKELR